MTGQDPLSPADREWLAADYALGLAEGDALLHAEHLFATDPAFQKETGVWSDWLARMLDEIEPVDPPSNLMPAIARRIIGGNRTNMESQLARWKAATVGLTALAASLAGLLLFQPNRYTVPDRAPPPVVVGHSPMVATMRGDSALFVANWDGNRTLTLVPVEAAAAPRAHAHELWMIPADGKPRSMGLVSNRPSVLEIGSSTIQLLADGATFAVSVEPAGGSPTGQPTGPVIASGKLTTA